MPATLRTTTHRRQKGAAIAELAVAIPVFFMLFLGVIDFARAMWTYNTLDHAAREVARYASVHSEDSGKPVTLADLTRYARNRAVGLSADHLTVNARWSPSNTTGSTVQIDLVYQFSPVVSIIPDNIRTLRGTSQMRVTY
jgi:Flp pilus assembly protein TadG